MARKLTAHRLQPDPAWCTAIANAYEALNERGQKKRVYEAAGVGKSTAHRIATGDTDNISYDSMEALRVAINEERGASVIPPAFTPVRSVSHHRAIEAARELDERGQLEAFGKWLILGQKLVEHGLFVAMVGAIERRLEAELAVAQSSDEIARVSAEHMAPVSRSRATPKVHGMGTHTERARVHPALPKTGGGRS